MANFIFMLTRADKTIEDAEARLTETIAAGVQHIGFKDKGLPLERLRSLSSTIRQAGVTLYLEVVSLDAVTEQMSARTAVELEVDVLMGGTRPDLVLPIIAGSRIRYFPFPGKIVGHPSVLEGSIESIVESAAALISRDGVNGLDLLAYRSKENPLELTRKVCQVAGQKPVIIAGSIDSAQRIEDVVEAGAAGFTIGTAALDNVFPVQPRLKAQIDYIHRVRDEAIRRFCDHSRRGSQTKLNN